MNAQSSVRFAGIQRQLVRQSYGLLGNAAYMPLRQLDGKVRSQLCEALGR